MLLEISFFRSWIEASNSFLAPTGAQEVALSVCPSVTFMNSSLNLIAASQQSLSILSAV